MSRVKSDAYRSPEDLAQAFGSAVLVPSWWPADARTIEYSLMHSHHETYRAGSIRHGGVPILVIGWLKVPGSRSPRDWVIGEWSEPPELAQQHGLLGRVGEPPQLQAVIYDENLEIQLFGYATEEEIFSTVKSLRRIAPD